MIKLSMLLSKANIFVLLSALTCATGAIANDSSIDIKLSVGSTWQSSNKVQIPNDSQATRFALDDIAGSGPFPAIRFEAIWSMNEKHALRVLLAPLSYRETGNINEEIRFAGATFNTDQAVQAEYRFNSWRLGYQYHLVARENWDFWLGGTLKVRDAEIRLTQGAVSSSDDNIGLVPLLHLAGEYRLGDRWSLVADLDGLAGGPGRAIDLGLGLDYRMSEQWRLGVEYRTLEGGADTDDVYNFAWFNSLLLSAKYRL